MTKDIVEDFLSQFHQKMKIFRIIFRDDRGKNLQTLLDLEITPTQREDIIKQLEVEDYIDGPSDDTLNNIAPLWVFGKKVKNKDVYIKISMGRPNTSVICISFHIAERQLKYKFKHS